MPSVIDGVALYMLGFVADQGIETRRVWNRACEA